MTKNKKRSLLNWLTTLFACLAFYILSQFNQMHYLQSTIDTSWQPLETLLRSDQHYFIQLHTSLTTAASADTLRSPYTKQAIRLLYTPFLRSHYYDAKLDKDMAALTAFHTFLDRHFHLMTGPSAPSRSEFDARLAKHAILKQRYNEHVSYYHRHQTARFTAPLLRFLKPQERQLIPDSAFTTPPYISTLTEQEKST